MSYLILETRMKSSRGSLFKEHACVLRRVTFSFLLNELRNRGPWGFLTVGCPPVWGHPLPSDILVQMSKRRGGGVALDQGLPRGSALEGYPFRLEYMKGSWRRQFFLSWIQYLTSSRGSRGGYRPRVSSYRQDIPELIEEATESFFRGWSSCQGG